MKKKYGLMPFAAMYLGISILAGCQQTPKEAIVREKGASGIKKYESAEAEESVRATEDENNSGKTEDKEGAGDGNSTEDGSGARDENGTGTGKAAEGSQLRKLLGAPERYVNQESYEGGALVIDSNAEVILPEAKSFHTYTVAAKEVNQDMIDQVTRAFFEGDKVYHMYSYTEWTKEDYQEDITRLKQYKAQGNLDPYGYGKGENGELLYDIDAEIAMAEEAMKDAPDTIVKEEVKPSFGLEHITEGEGGEMQKAVDDDSFWGVVETGHGNYDYYIKYSLAPDITIKISKAREDQKDPRVTARWTEGQYLLDNGEGQENYMSEDSIKKFVDIPLADAQKEAEETIGRLGWDWKVNSWDYALYYQGREGANQDSIVDGGYYFHFTRELDNVPLTYTDSYGGGLEDMDSTLVPWSYERCDVVVGDDGIQEVEICNPYEVGEVQTENVKLMDFDSVVKIYEQMMEIMNADMQNYEEQRTYHIRKITLGYSRIYDPTTENDKGLLVPVWDFFGGVDVTAEGYNDKDSGEHSNESYLTINAVDGTVINRGLGY